MKRFLPIVNHSNDPIDKTYEEIALQIWCENFICRDFTKRQLKILALIYTLSVHNKQLECYLPTLSSFEIAGISRHKIKDEIHKLQEANVIDWDQETMIFKMRTDVENWKVEFTEKYTPHKFEQLTVLNDLKFKPSW